MKLILEKAARKGLNRMSAKTADALLQRLEAIAAAPDAKHANVKPLAGARDAFGLPQGDCRAVYLLDRKSDELRVVLVDVKRECVPLTVLPKPIAVTKNTVLLSRKDWKAVIEALEDAEDRVAVRTIIARRAAGKHDGLPAELYRRLRAGEHPIRIWRAQRKMSLTTLADRAAVARAYLSEIETGKKPGSVSALQKVARALGVDLDELAPKQPRARG